MEVREEANQMRGNAKRQQVILTLETPGDRIPKTHPIRKVKWMVDIELKQLEPLLDGMYSDLGRPSIPPEWLLKSMVLMALFTVRSERAFCDRLNYDLMFRYFLDMNMIDEAFDPSSFAKNRKRLMESEVAARFFDAVVNRAKMMGLLSMEHFSVDGTMIEAWASMKSFRPKDEKQDDREPPDDPGNPTVNFHGEKRSNQTHQSTTDLQAKLFRKGKGKEAKLSFMGHALMENRNGLCVDISVSEANGFAERAEALSLLDRQRKLRGLVPRTVAGDKGYDTHDFVEELRCRGITPHVAQNITEHRGSNIDGRTTWREGYRLSQRSRKKIEEIFGWGKTIGGLRKTRYRGTARTGFYAYFAGAAYNLIRMTKLLPDMPAV
jgi:transposase